MSFGMLAQVCRSVVLLSPKNTSAIVPVENQPFRLVFTFVFRLVLLLYHICWEQSVE